MSPFDKRHSCTCDPRGLPGTVSGLTSLDVKPFQDFRHLSDYPSDLGWTEGPVSTFFSLSLTFLQRGDTKSLIQGQLPPFLPSRDNLDPKTHPPRERKTLPCCHHPCRPRVCLHKHPWGLKEYRLRVLSFVSTEVLSLNLPSPRPPGRSLRSLRRVGWVRSSSRRVEGVDILPRYGEEGVPVHSW